MRPNDTSHGLSSPISTNDIGSANGSPDTKLTAYSPEDMRSICLRSDTSVGDTLGDIGARKLYLASSSDPFLASTNTSTRVQLSPTAASFTPIGTADNASIRSKAPSLSRGFSGAGYLTASSDIDPCEARNGPLQASDRFSLKYGVIGNSQADTRDHPVIRDYETFGSESHSRALVIENVPKNLTYMSLAGFFNRREFSSLRGPVLSELSSMGKVYVAFTDSREAAKAIEKVKVLRPEWHVSTIAPKEYVKHVEPSLLPQTSNYEGQLLVTVYYDGRNPNLNQHTIARSLETLSMTFGDIKTFASLPIEQENIGEFHIEYFNTRDADNVLTTLNGTSVDRRPIDIIDFVNARAGRTWNCFNSDKVAEVSYATPDWSDGQHLTHGRKPYGPGWLVPLHGILVFLMEWWKSLDHQQSYGSVESSADQLRHHLLTYVMPKCYQAFSAVVADGQFSTLGTVLIATLARLAKATEIDKELKLPSNTEKASTGPVYSTGAQRREDMGVVLCRPACSSTPTLPHRTQVPGSSRRARDERSLKAPKGTVGSKEKSMRKKKRKKDAIDDLFDSLL
ncbi:hypothetical protein CBS63078_920 [Aspergillus niger]|nr:hypothetical protein CBS115989_7251 [Aspergillus niger]KAI2826752.1 hypothetical protein CBS133816_7140 [Aspergillus niger]KAI2840351.1 hypothetical protein CBS12448_10598 [Aspergillus niger]KAI2842699.1 hypothetical protein CBS11350_5667 [Aspergillus niger]KAI2850640.1 hypothetical protein CBS11232_6190 [Aspergillus niger]